MRPLNLLALVWSGLLVVASAFGDGGFFFRTEETQALDLAQTRQEVVIAFHGTVQAPLATYVLRGRYAGTPADFAWVIPLPATPADVLAHEHDDLFEVLDGRTRPTFTIYRESPRTSGWWLGCGGMAGDMGRTEETEGAVEVEAQGQAGIFDWAALTSTGGTALRQWLNDNGYAVPAEADDVLQAYIAGDMHFLAVRISEPGALTGGPSGEIELPPIQFTCQTARRFYPIAISRVSAAERTEVLIYVLGAHRARAANVPNAVIDPDALRYDPNSPSQTNYESALADTIAELGGVALVTEAAWAQSNWSDRPWVDARFWPDAPVGALAQTFLTRMRTVIARDRMTLDFEFEDAPVDRIVENHFWIDVPSEVSTAALVGQPAAAVLLAGLLRVCVRRRVHRRP